jgi:deoxyribodipyrimidine photo-lyase
LTTAIWWLRRDLRLSDNPALHGALTHADTVIPLFVLDPGVLHSRYHRHAARRRAFLFGGLRALEAALRQRGSRLLVLEGQPLEALTILFRETGATAIYAQEDFSPYARQRDAAVAAALPLHLTAGITVRHPEDVRKASGGPYTVFTPFSRAWRALPLPGAGDLIPAPEHLHAPPADLASAAIPAATVSFPFPPGEAEAQRRLARFTDGHDAPIFDYAEGRDRLDVDGTSALSPYLRFGMLSPRQAVVTALSRMAAAASKAARAGAEVWLTELLWREFYVSILYHFPHVLEREFNPALRHIPWQDDAEGLAAWQEGRTGYPVVDAAMRQLAQTGWLHNRGRMIAASFLVKDLLLDWRWGEQWFMEQLVDGDPAANNGGWQWTAGVGTDAAPYFRIFNPILQGQKYDPAGRFVRRYVPELANVPDRYVHTPWEMPLAAQQAAGCVIGQDYPAPIVEHTLARERTLAAYRQAQGLVGTQMNADFLDSTGGKRSEGS